VSPDFAVLINFSVYSWTLRASASPTKKPAAAGSSLDWKRRREHWFVE
jgi:hypothetical protein